jgi:hypothetical protein
LNRNGPPKDKRPPLPNGPGHGRTAGTKNRITRDWVEKHLRWRVEFDPVQALLARHGKGKGATWTLRDIAALNEQERMCLESYDVVKGNVDQTDNALETVIKPRWYPKDKALELCARSLGMLKDKVEISAPEELLSKLDRAKVRARGSALTRTEDE